MAWKDEFKKTCENPDNKDKGQWVEDADGSFGCNYLSGTQIKCKDDSCTVKIPLRGTGLVVTPTRPGIGEIITLSPGSSTGIAINLTMAGVGELLNLRSDEEY